MIYIAHEQAMVQSALDDAPEVPRSVMFRPLSSCSLLRKRLALSRKAEGGEIVDHRLICCRDLPDFTQAMFGQCF